VFAVVAVAVVEGVSCLTIQRITCLLKFCRPSLLTESTTRSIQPRYLLNFFVDDPCLISA
jgi:hypothetical protein